jgi:hypothetical protein
MKKHQPALLGGVFIGVLSSLPIVGGFNACCCLWVVSGGLLTVYLQQQAKAEPIETGEAVVGGLIAGLIGALITVAIQAAIFSAGAPMVQESIRQAMEQAPEMPQEARDLVMRLTTGRNILLVSLAMNLPLFAIFGMLGALLGTAFFKKKLPPAAPPATPPMTTTGI